MKQDQITVCYIVIDDSSLRYSKLLMISLSSLRLRNPEIPVCIFTDECTVHAWPATYRAQLDDLDAEVKTICIPDSYSPVERSRYIKTSLRSYISGDILFIDTDTVIADTFTYDELDSDLMLVRDMNYDPATQGKIPGGLSYDLDGHRELAKQAGYPFHETDDYFNGGVFFARDNNHTRLFFERWHEEWEKCRTGGLVKDQPSLNFVNQQFGKMITPLSDSWNVQVYCPYSLRYVGTAKVLHYWVSIEEDRAFMLSRREIMELDLHDETMKAIINSPKESFVPFQLTTLSREQISVTKSYAFQTIFALYHNFRFVFRCINYMCSLPSRIIRKWKNKAEN